MASMMASVGEPHKVQGSNPATEAAIYNSIERLARWLEKN